MLYFFIFLVLFFIIFDLCTRKYLNPYKLIMIFGKKGSGKTTTLTKIAITNIRKGRKVYSTVKIPGTYFFRVEQIGRFTFEPDSIVLIDEVGMVWDNRDYGSFKPEVRDFFKLQRQYKLTVYLFSQAFDIDKKLRDLTDEMYLLTNFARVFSVQRRILKRIAISNASSNSSGTSSLVDDYKYDFILGGIKIVYIPRWTSFFKSYDPTKLAYINGTYCDLNDVQTRYISTKNWIIDKIKIAFLKIFYCARSQCQELIYKIKGVFHA